MSENQNEDGLMVLTVIVVVIVIVHKNSEAIFKFLEALFIGIGKLMLIGFCGFLVFLILKGVFMSLVKLKNTIDALKYCCIVKKCVINAAC